MVGDCFLVWWIMDEVYWEVFVDLLRKDYLLEYEVILYWVVMFFI